MIPNFQGSGGNMKHGFRVATHAGIGTFLRIDLHIFADADGASAVNFHGAADFDGFVKLHVLSAEGDQIHHPLKGINQGKQNPSHLEIRSFHW